MILFAHFQESVVRLLWTALPIPGPRPTGVALDVEEDDGVGTVGAEALGQVNAVALDAHVVHKTPPLLAKQVLPALQPVEEEVPRPRRELLRVAVASAVKVERDVRVDADGEVVVKHVQRQAILGVWHRRLRDEGFIIALHAGCV